MKFYHQTTEQTLARLNTTVEGLSSERAAQLLLMHGPNELKEKQRMPPWQLFLMQFKDFMILVLAAAAILSGIMGDITDTIIILFILLLNAIIGFLQEYRAEKALDALKKMSITQASVLRDGNTVFCSSAGLAPGDIVLLEAGNVVPADIRLIETHLLRIDESSLTGESIPAEKHSNT